MTEQAPTTSLTTGLAVDGAPNAVDALLARVGARVRQARDARGLPRRVLSDLSGVSPRHLAQLEAGTGNISLALLQRVARALDVPLEHLVGADDPWTSDVVRAAGLFRAASPEVQAQALALLGAAGPEGGRAQRICLVGLRGAGKSTLGRMASAALDAPFVELNEEVARRAGMPVPEIMALYGPEGYRQLEADALEQVVAGHARLILAVGGGIVAEAATYTRLLATFHCIWIKAAPEDHMSRVRAQGDMRPMAGHPEAMAQLKAILRAREALYARAHAVLDTAGATEDQSRSDLLTLIADQRLLA